MHIAGLVKIPCHLLKLSSGIKNIGVSRVDNSVKKSRNLPISNSKSDLLNFNIYSKFGKNPLLFTQVIVRKRKYVRVWRNLPISNPKPISTISMHTPSLVKIHWCLLKLYPETKNGQTDRQTHGRPTWTIIPLHYCVAGYKNVPSVFTLKWM